MIRIFLLLVLAVSTNAMAASGRVLCMTMNMQLEDIRAHMPMQIDETTTVVDLLVSYEEPVCTLDYQATVDSKKFAEVLASAGGLPASQYLEWLKTDDGHEVMKEEYTFLSSQMAGPHVDTFKAVDDVMLKYTYRYDDESMRPIVITAIDTTK